MTNIHDNSPSDDRFEHHMVLTDFISGGDTKRKEMLAQPEATCDCGACDCSSCDVACTECDCSACAPAACDVACGDSTLNSAASMALITNPSFETKVGLAGANLSATNVAAYGVVAGGSYTAASAEYVGGYWTTWE